MLKWAYKKQLEDRLKLEGTNGHKYRPSYPGRQYFQSRRRKISEQIKEEFLCDACSKSVTDQYFTAGKVFFKYIEGINIYLHFSFQWEAVSPWVFQVSTLWQQHWVWIFSGWGGSHYLQQKSWWHWPWAGLRPRTEDCVIMTILCAMCAAVQASQKCSHCGQPFQHDTAEITLIGDLMLHPDCFK